MKRLPLFGVVLMVACSPDDTRRIADPLVPEHPETDPPGHPTPDRVPLSGRFLFEQETFEGNGRTCRTCHGARTGSISPEEVQARFESDPSEPLFRPLDSDDQGGENYTRLQHHATILAGVDLAENVSLQGHPEQRTVLFPRGVPTTLNTPALDPVLMYDGRAPGVAEQAGSAIFGHAQPGRAPTGEELALIAEFEMTESFFSSPVLYDFSLGGPEPELPKGDSESEKRGRTFLLPDGLCGGCHGGPMLNQTASGRRFLSVGVSERNVLGNKVRTFDFKGPEGVTSLSSADPGRALITGDLQDANRFKIPPLWGVADTAPYFHDNSAKSLEDLMDHYDVFFNGRGTDLTEQDKVDIIAYLQLL